MKTLSTREFRPTFIAWFGEFALPLLFFVILGITAVNKNWISPTAFAIGMSVLAMVLVNSILLPLLRTSIRFERSSVEGRINGRPFLMYYGEIIAAWRVKNFLRRFVCLGGRNGTIFFPLNFFDGDSIWKEFELRLAPEVQAPEAIEALIAQQISRRGPRAVAAEEDLGPSVVVDHWSFQVVGWSGLSYSVLSGLAKWQLGDLHGALVFLIPGVISLFVLLRWGITHITPDAIRRSTLLGSHTIAWTDVRWMEADPLGLAIVLGGEGGQLAIPGPVAWSAVGRVRALRMMHSQLEERGIPIRRTLKAILRFTRRS